MWSLIVICQLSWRITQPISKALWVSSRHVGRTEEGRPAPDVGGTKQQALASTELKKEEKNKVFPFLLQRSSNLLRSLRIHIPSSCRFLAPLEPFNTDQSLSDANSHWTPWWAPGPPPLTGSSGSLHTDVIHTKSVPLLNVKGYTWKGSTKI